MVDTQIQHVQILSHSLRPNLVDLAHGPNHHHYLRVVDPARDPRLYMTISRLRAPVVCRDGQTRCTTTRRHHLLMGTTGNLDRHRQTQTRTVRVLQPANQNVCHTSGRIQRDGSLYQADRARAIPHPVPMCRKPQSMVVPRPSRMKTRTTRPNHNTGRPSWVI